MFNANSIFLVAWSSQLVFGTVFLMLALRDRRSAGTWWFASATLFQLLVSSLHHQVERTSLSHTISGALSVVEFTMVWAGVSRVTRRRDDAPWLVLLFALLGSGIIIGMMGIPSPWPRVTSRAVDVSLGIASISMLLRCRVPGMRKTVRAVTLLIAVQLIVVGARVWLVLVPAPHGLDLLLSSFSVAAADLVLLGLMSLSLADTHGRLLLESRTDALTGLHNLRSLEEAAPLCVEAAQRDGSPFSLVVLDADHFKRLNDRDGHAAGDEALRLIARTLTRSSPRSAFVARTGGEEFAVLLPGTRREAAMSIAERIRRRVGSLHVNEVCLQVGDRNMPLTVSAGVSTLLPGEHVWSEVLCRADRALYRAKRDGRDRVCAWEPEDGPTIERQGPAPSWRADWPQGVTDRGVVQTGSA